MNKEIVSVLEDQDFWRIGKTTIKKGAKTESSPNLPSPDILYNIQSGGDNYEIPSNILELCVELKKKVFLVVDSESFNKMRKVIEDSFSNSANFPIDMILVIDSSPLKHASTMCALEQMPHLRMIGYSAQQPITNKRSTSSSVAAYYKSETTPTKTVPASRRTKSSKAKEEVPAQTLPTLFQSQITYSLWTSRTVGLHVLETSDFKIATARWKDFHVGFFKLFLLFCKFCYIMLIIRIIIIIIIIIIFIFIITIIIIIVIIIIIITIIIITD